MNSLNKFLLLLVLLQAFAIWAVYRKSEKDVDATPLLTSEFLTKIEIADPQGSVILEKSGDAWILPQAGGVAAQKDRVDSLVTDLQEVTLGRAIVKNVTSHRRLKVAADDFSKKVVINGQTTFFVGTSPAPRVAHVRLAEEDAVYQVENFNTWSLGTRRAQWVENLILDVRKPDIQEFQLISEKGDFRFSKIKEGEEERYQFHDSLPAPEGKEFDATDFSIWVNQQGSWILRDVVDVQVRPEYGFGNPTATLNFVLVSKKESEEKEEEKSEATEESEEEKLVYKDFSLIIGARVEGKEEYYARASDKERIVTVPADRIQQLIERDRESFYEEVEESE